MTTRLQVDNIEAIKNQFPIFKNNPTIVYLDSGASTQKPQSVIEAELEFYQNSYSNIHRGIHQLGRRATEKFENARARVQDFLNAESFKEIIFTKGSTESINLVANAYLKPSLDESSGSYNIVTTIMEHHANIVPWQQLQQQYSNLELKWATINQAGEINHTELIDMIDANTKLLAITYVSNVLGTINDLQNLIRQVKSKQPNIKILVDASQAVSQFRINVQQLDCDFLVFTGHKLFGPTGIGVLYAKRDLLEQMQPYQGGGDMIEVVTKSSFSVAQLPYKFEDGTPNIAGAVGLAAAIEFVEQIGLENMFTYESYILDYATKNLAQIDELSIIGTAKQKIAITTLISNTPDIHVYDIATLIGEQGICMRDGHHCAMPLLEFYNANSSLRASMSIYNNTSDIDKMIVELKSAINILM